MNQQPKIGDEVWVPSATLDRIWETCPDCLGTARWHCSLPNGDEFDIECPRCYPGGYSASTGKIGERYEVVGKATRAKINRIEVREDRTEYGTDSGYIYQPEDLCFDEASAVTRSVVKTREWADAEYKRKSEYARSKGRPKRGRDGERIADHADGPHSVTYARSQVRRAMKDAQGWIEFAARKGVQIDLEAKIVSRGSPARAE